MSETSSERLIRLSATAYLAVALCAYAAPFIIVGAFCAVIL